MLEELETQRAVLDRGILQVPQTSGTEINTLCDLLSQKLELEAKIAEAKNAARVQAIEAVRALMASSGVTLADLGHKPGVNGKAGKVRKPVAVKYRSPTGDTWTGRGRTPLWVVKAQVNGQTLEQFRVWV